MKIAENAMAKHKKEVSTDDQCTATLPLEAGIYEHQCSDNNHGHHTTGFSSQTITGKFKHLSCFHL